LIASGLYNMKISLD